MTRCGPGSHLVSSAGLVLLSALLVSAAGGQQDAAPAQEEPNGDAPRTFESGAQAYEAGAYDEALAQFVELQVGRPQDPALMMNIGSTHFRKGDFEAAKRGFGAAAESAEESMKAEAVYNLGNVAFREGRLEEAVELYKSALVIDPDDIDSKFNLEFVRRAIERQKQQPQDGQQNQEPGDQSQDGEQGDSSSAGEDSQEQETESPQSPPEETDTDHDGLSDETETSGENPTDPLNPDSDGDGLSDGEEDRNKNGRTDPGETDPNNADSNGNGIDDGAEARNRQSDSRSAEQRGEMSEEEAERYLQALQEGKPQNRRPRGRRRAQEKDW